VRLLRARVHFSLKHCGDVQRVATGHGLKAGTIPALKALQARGGAHYDVRVPWGRRDDSFVRTNIFTDVRVRGGPPTTVVVLGSSHASQLRMHWIAGGIVYAEAAFASLMGTRVTRDVLNDLFARSAHLDYSPEEAADAFALWLSELDSVERPRAAALLAKGKHMLDVMRTIYSARAGAAAGAARATRPAPSAPSASAARVASHAHTAHPTPPPQPTVAPRPSSCPPR
jgi:hypothetical protein